MNLATANTLDLDRLLRDHGRDQGRTDEPTSAPGADDARFVAGVMRRVAAEEAALLPADEALRLLQAGRPPRRSRCAAGRPPPLWMGGLVAIGAGLAVGAWWWSPPAATLAAPSSPLSLVWGAVAALVAWAWLAPADDHTP
jgi:hypothetical protein